MMGPEGYPPGMMGPGMMGPGMMGPCPECGGPFAGCVRSHVDRWGRNPYGLFAGLGGCLAGLPSLLVPYGEGGIASQRWFDASLEVIGLNRTTGGSNFAVSSLGANSGNFVLGTDMVAPDSMQAGLAPSADAAASVRQAISTTAQDVRFRRAAPVGLRCTATCVRHRIRFAPCGSRCAIATPDRLPEHDRPSVRQ
jgi:hypothetical protein